MNSKPILQPLPDEALSAETAASLSGHVLNIHRMIAHSPELLRRSVQLRNYLVKGSALSERQRELLILRTGYLVDSPYEWAHHVVRGQAAGLVMTEIERVRAGGQAKGWTADEKALLNMVDEMHGRQHLGAETQAQVLALLGPAGLIDAIFTIGYYITLGTILNSFDVPLDDHITSP